MTQKRYIVEAKLGMSDAFSVIGEFDTYEDARVCLDTYYYEQTQGDLPAEGDVIDIDSLE